MVKASKPGNRQQKVTIRQVAEAAGVSIATVSRVLNGHADVSGATRQAVERVLRERGYRAGGRRLRTASETGLIGVTMPLVHPGYFAQILSGAAEALYEHDLRAVVGPTRHSHERETSLIDRLAGGDADGAVLVLPEESAGELRALSEHGFPFVVVDPRTEVPDGIPVVCAAHSSGATQATEHLLSLGHRRIGVIAGPDGWVATQERLRGYHAALAGVGVLPDESLVRYSNFRIDGGREEAAALFDLPDPPTAVFAFNDSMAIGVMQEGGRARAASPRRLLGCRLRRHRGGQRRRPRADHGSPAARRTGPHRGQRPAQAAERPALRAAPHRTRDPAGAKEFDRETRVGPAH